MFLVLLSAALGLPYSAGAQEKEAIRGGWLTNVGARSGIYMFIVRGKRVTGTYCVDCTDPDNLAFIIDGQLSDEGMSFVIRHEDGAGAVTFDDVQGRLVGKQLVLNVKPRGAARPTPIILHRPVPVPAPTAALSSRPPYVAPGAYESLSPDKVLGLWLSGVGPGKQYFIIRRAGTQLLGMVCGPCDNPNTMAPLDGFVFTGSALRFNIVHEDTGGAAEHGAFNNVAHATLARNELHLRVIPSYEPADSKPYEMTLLGPVVFQR